MQLVAYGAQDVYITSTTSFWQVTHRRHTNFAPEAINSRKRLLTRDEKFARIKRVKLYELQQITKTSDSEELMCSICFDDYNDETNNIVLLKCNHHNHENCLKQWICNNRNNNCPYCRTEVEELKLVYAEDDALPQENSNSENNSENNLEDESEDESEDELVESFVTDYIQNNELNDDNDIAINNDEDSDDNVSEMHVEEINNENNNESESESESESETEMEIEENDEDDEDDEDEEDEEDDED